jgi:pimeloyl-ACP methyl ester carboxylesterase
VTQLIKTAADTPRRRRHDTRSIAMASTHDQARTATLPTYTDASTQNVTAENGIEYAYRDVGDGDVPLVLLQHFRGNLDNWDPALIDALAADRRVVTFDNVGVGATTGRTPNTVGVMAHGAIALLEAMDFQRVDLLGFSIGSFVAQEIALVRPDLLRRVVLASSAPQGAAGMHGWAPEVIGAVGAPETTPQGYISVFFAPTDTSREAGQQAAGRIFGARTTDRDEPTTWQTRQAQYDAVCAWGIPNHSLLQRVASIDLPVFVANGDSDPMILPRYSYLLAGLLPDARVRIYPDSAHGFLFQHHSEFAADVNAFLVEAS